ncbi:hypothetical protein [Aporhodopirellula aestuarii]|uniref:Secreted protein n=1 Tax=Aporhodopirellula aestuarii TaxID=2950107 RepID=A0ABT0TZR7_9BACT|nr:hypothetical protein [Aporhodopirellula aestuarii]MCM2370093.1 hypothetical protein [Aporhodopirellula aestuarii]
MRRLSRQTLVFVVPWAVLCVLILSSMISWRHQSALLDDAFRSGMAVPADSDPLWLIRREDAATSDQQTTRWLRVLSANEALEEIYGDAFSYVQKLEQAAEHDRLPRPQKADELLSLYAEDAREIVDELIELSHGDQPIWEPTPLGSIGTRDPMQHLHIAITKCLSRVFDDASRRSDTERALTVLEVLARLASSHKDPPRVAREVLRDAAETTLHKHIAASLQHDVWSEQELERLMQLLAPSEQADSRWKTLLRHQIFDISRIEASGFDSRWGRGSPYRWWYTVAPSRRREQVLSLSQMIAMDFDGTSDFLFAVDAVEYEASLPNGVRGMDVLLQRPFLGADPLRTQKMASPSVLSKRLVQAENDRRFVRCGVAVRLFQKRFSRWPGGIEELQNVDMPFAERLTYAGNLFEWWASDPPRLSNSQRRIYGPLDGKNDLLWIEFEL